ncbi:MAG: hypothetical protein WD278_08920, partial [Pirellulales bacterium]
MPAHAIQLAARTGVVLLCAFDIGAAGRLVAGEPSSPGDERRPDAASPEFFEHEVAPLFARHCLGC